VLELGKHSLQRLQVAVDVGENREQHPDGQRNAAASRNIDFSA
jgi:hypothetical protein